MPDTDLHQTGLAALRVAAEAAELAQTASGLVSADGYRLVGTQQAMDTAIGGILRAFGYAIAPFGSGGAWLVTDLSLRGTEAGR